MLLLVNNVPLCYFATLLGPPEDPSAFAKALGKEPDFSAAARHLGLEASPVQLSRTAILKGIHPMIVSLLGEADVITTVRILEERLGEGSADPALIARTRTRYAVLAEVRGTNAIVLDPLAGRTAIPVLVLLDRVSGDGTVWSQSPATNPRPRLVQERGARAVRCTRSGDRQDGLPTSLIAPLCRPYVQQLATHQPGSSRRECTAHRAYCTGGDPPFWGGGRDIVD